jgi:hypothetical protein
LVVVNGGRRVDDGVKRKREARVGNITARQAELLL